MVKKLVIYLLATLVLAAGINFVINSNLGIAPITFLPYAISTVFDQISIGTYIIFFGIVYYLGQVIGLRKNFDKTQHLQLPMAFGLGIFVDFTNFILNVSSEGIVMQIVNLSVGTLLISSSIIILFTVNVCYPNAEGFVKYIAERYNYRFSVIKMIFDAVHVLAGLAILLISNTPITGIGIGTIVAVGAVGPLISILTPSHVKFLRLFLDV